MKYKGDVKPESVLILDYLSMPSDIKDIVSEDYRFGNDRYLEHISEMSPSEDQTWKDSLTKEGINEYWTEQCNSNGYLGDLEDFIKDHGLVIDTWLLEQNFNLDIKKILINISW